VYGIRIFVSDLINSEPANQPFPGYSIGVKNTANSTLTNNSGSSGGEFIAARAPQDETFVAGSAKEFIFDSPINWTGSNFAISFAWCKTPGSFSNTGRCLVGPGSSFHAQSDDSGCFVINDEATNGVTSGRPVLQLLYRIE
jgi:hypothetical protein